MERTQKLIKNIQNVKIAKSAIHGLGLFTKKYIPGNIVVGRLDGQKVDTVMFPDTLDGEWNGIGGNQILFRCIPTLYSYINHSMKPNLTIINQSMEIKSLRDIPENEELLINYIENGIPERYLKHAMGQYLR